MLVSCNRGKNHTTTYHKGGRASDAPSPKYACDPSSCACYIDIKSYRGNGSGITIQFSSARLFIVYVLYITKNWTTNYESPSMF